MRGKTSSSSAAAAAAVAAKKKEQKAALGPFFPASLAFRLLSSDANDRAKGQETNEVRGEWESGGGIEAQNFKRKELLLAASAAAHFNRCKTFASNTFSLLLLSPPRSFTYLGRRGDGQEGTRGEERKGGGGGARHGCEKVSGGGGGEGKSRVGVVSKKL